jgi:hypothetical protein
MIPYKWRAIRNLRIQDIFARSLELEKNCEKNLLETYRFFEEVVIDGLKKRDDKNKRP